MEQRLLFGKQLWRVHLYGRSRYGASILVAEQALRLFKESLRVKPILQATVGHPHGPEASIRLARKA